MIADGSAPFGRIASRTAAGSALEAPVAAAFVATAVWLTVAAVGFAGIPVAAAELSPAPSGPCAGVTAGPAGVDIEAACVGREVVENYTGAGRLDQDALNLLVVAIAAGLLCGVLALATWDATRRRLGHRLAPARPAAYWLCDACNSFNPIDRDRCYRCRATRDETSRVASADGPPPWKQRFGHPWTGTDEPIDPRSGPRRD